MFNLPMLNLVMLNLPVFNLERGGRLRSAVREPGILHER